MPDTLIAPVEYRADTSRQGPGRLYGVLLNYGEPAGDGRRERFAPGSLEWPEEGVVLRLQHDRMQPIMRVVPETRENAVVVDAPLPDTQRGRDAAVMVRDGTLGGLSVEFRARRQHYPNGIREITSAVLTGAGLVDSPSYRGSRVELRGEVDGWGGLLWL